jgi:putative oxidoreductase
MELLVPIGRLLFSVLFIQSGIGHFRQRAGMTAYARSAGVPFPEIMVPLTGLMILVGGLSVLLGVYARVGAWLLVLFLIPTALIVHRFRGVPDPQVAQNQRAHFHKNLALAGGALLIAYFGSGPYSLLP